MMLETKVIRIDSQNIDLEKIERAAEVIKKGGLVAFPTETVYGLGADFLNKRAVARVFAVKRRPRDKALTVQIADITYLEKLTDNIPAFAYQLMSKFWPGPLTLVLPAKTKDNETIGVRIPNHPIAQALIRASQTPLVVPSANFSGEAAARTPEEVLQFFDGLIELLIDSGPTELGTASTVVDLSVSPYRILREGAITQEDIQGVQN